jgi:hypothetical protein
MNTPEGSTKAARAGSYPSLDPRPIGESRAICKVVRPVRASRAARGARAQKADPMGDSTLSLRQVLAMTGTSEQVLKVRVAQGQFPPAISGRQPQVWDAADVLLYMAGGWPPRTARSDWPPRSGSWR